MTHWKSAVYAAVMAAAGTISPAEAKNDYVLGPQPVWSDYKALGDAALRAQLPIPKHGRSSGPMPILPATGGIRARIEAI